MRYFSAALALLWLVGCGGSDVPESVNELCRETGEATCSRARECFPQGAPSQGECVSVFVQACCGDDGTCDQEIDDINEDAWSDCIDGFDDLSCEQLDNGAIPPRCLSLRTGAARGDVPPLRAAARSVSVR